MRRSESYAGGIWEDIVLKWLSLSRWNLWQRGWGSYQEIFGGRASQSITELHRENSFEHRLWGNVDACTAKRPVWLGRVGEGEIEMKSEK